MKRIIVLATTAIAVSALLMGVSAQAGNKWRCVATNARGSQYSWYAPVRATARAQSLSRCRGASAMPRTCTVRCFAPALHWRCVAHSTPPRGVNPRNWYYDSPSKSTAISNAIALCKKNSKYGGCFAPRGACTAF